MKIGKTELRNYFGKLFAKEVNIEQKKINDHIIKVFEPLVTTKLYDMYEIRKKVQKAADQLHTFIEEEGLVEDFGWNQRIRDLNQFGSWVGNLKVNCIDDIRSHILKDRPYTKLGLYNYVENVKKEIKVYQSTIDQLRTLEHEIANVITSAANGTQAYKELEHLGIDLKDIEAAQARLPAIQKFSVDPSIINGKEDSNEQKTTQETP